MNGILFFVNREVPKNAERISLDQFIAKIESEDSRIRGFKSFNFRAFHLNP
jgi:hypothetical protein